MNALQQRLLLQARIKANRSKPHVRDDARGGPSLQPDVAGIKSLQERQAADMKSLETSLALQSIWGSVFDGALGVVTSWHGKPAAFAGAYDLTLHVTSGKGVTRTFPQHDVPEVLWPTPHYGHM